MPFEPDLAPATGPTPGFVPDLPTPGFVPDLPTPGFVPDAPSLPSRVLQFLRMPLPAPIISLEEKRRSLFGRAKERIPLQTRAGLMLRGAELLTTLPTTIGGGGLVAGALAFPAFPALKALRGVRPPPAMPITTATERLATASERLAAAAAKAPQLPERAIEVVGKKIGAPLFETRVSQMTTGQIARAAHNEATALAGTQASQAGQRLFRQVAEALEKGEIHVESLPQVIRDQGLSLPQFVSEYAKTISTSGRQLQQLSRLRQALDKIASTDPLAKSALKALDETRVDTFWSRLMYGKGRWPGYVAVDNVRRASLVAQLATTMRNIWSQTGRYGLDALDQTVQGALGGQGLSSAPEHALAFFRNIKQQPALQNVLKAFPLEQARLLSNPAGEVSLGSKYAKLINTFNTLQESFFRRALFDAHLRNGLKRTGMDIQASLASPKSIPTGLVRQATSAALEGTFVSTPGKDTLGQAIVTAYRAIPPLTTINPFPRFLTNSYKFLIDFNPTGYLRLMGRDVEGKLLAGNPQIRNQILSRASLGTSMLAMGAGFRRSTYAGDKWYEIKVGGKVYDARPFAPFSTYLFLGQVMNTMSDVGAEKIRTGSDLADIFSRKFNMTTQDIVQGLLSINRIAGTGLVAIDLIREGSFNRKLDLVRDMAAQYISGFTVPFRTLKDIIAGGVVPGISKDFAEEEAKYRDTKKNLIAPAFANVPGLSGLLPEAKSPLRPETPRAETPLLRQFTGVSSRDKNILEKEIDKLGIEFKRIAPRTGNVELDRKIAGSMGQILLGPASRIISSPGYQALDENRKRLTLLTAIKVVRKAATLQGLSQIPVEAGRSVILGRYGPEMQEIIGERSQ